MVSHVLMKDMQRPMDAKQKVLAFKRRPELDTRGLSGVLVP